MDEYHKIQTVFKRDIKNNGKSLIEGEYSTPEIEYLANNRWVFTEKVDGTNIRVMWDGDRVRFGGRTNNAQLPAPLVEVLAARFYGNPAFRTLEENGVENICLYGEGYGAKIQKGGGNYRPDQDFVLFDVKVGDWWLRREDVEEVAESFGLDVVPVLGAGQLRHAVEMARHGIPSAWGNFEAEGIVARPEVEMFDRAGRRIITKIKCRDFPREPKVVTSAPATA